MPISPAIPSAEAVPLHHAAQQALRRRAGRRLMWGVVVGMVLLVGLPLVGTYLAWQARGRAKLRTELGRLRAASTPIASADMNARYQASGGPSAATQRWMAAIRPFDGYAQTMRSLADLPDGYLFPKLSDNLRDEAALRAKLQSDQALIDGLHRAASAGGQVQYPHDYTDGSGMLLPECDQLQGAKLALQLEFLCAAREKNFPLVMRNLQTRLRAADTLADQPIPVSLLVRLSQHAAALDDLLAYVGYDEALSDDQLAQLQSLVEALDYRPQQAQIVIGEQAMLYTLCHFRFSTEQQMQQLLVPKVTVDDGSGVWRPEDCAQTLAWVGRLEAAVHLHQTPALLDEIDAVEAEVKALDNADQVTRWRFLQSRILLPPFCEMLRNTTRGQAKRDLALIAVAVRRYELAHQSTPEQLRELAPRFVPQPLVDPMDEQPFRLIKAGRALKLYSIGPDRTDDGGALSADQGQMDPDVVVELKLLSQS